MLSVADLCCRSRRQISVSEPIVLQPPKKRVAVIATATVKKGK